MFIDYYEVLDKYMNKMKEDNHIKTKMKEYFCHHSYRKRYVIDEKFVSYCKFFDLEVEYMIKNTVEMENSK